MSGVSERAEERVVQYLMRQFHRHSTHCALFQCLSVSVVCNGKPVCPAFEWLMSRERGLETTNADCFHFPALSLCLRFPAQTHAYKYIYMYVYGNAIEQFFSHT